MKPVLWENIFKNREKTRTIYPKNHENPKNSKPRVHFFKSRASFIVLVTLLEKERRERKRDTLLEEIFAVEALPRNFQILQKFNFADTAIPQISRELIFAETNIGKKRKWKKKTERESL